jgi:hypothetical protein
MLKMREEQAAYSAALRASAAECARYHGADGKGFRPLRADERAARHTCPHCGDRHGAWDAAQSMATCRHCGAFYWPRRRLHAP